MNLPNLEDCKPGIRATGFNVLVALPDKEGKIGSIILPDNLSDRERMAQVRGRVVSISPAAFDFANFGDAHAKEGDAVVFAKFAGIVIEGDDKREYRLLQDKDVAAIVEETA